MASAAAASNAIGMWTAATSLAAGEPLPPQDPDLSVAHVRMRLEAAIVHRSQLEVEMKVTTLQIAWLSRLLRRCVIREIAADIGAEVPLSSEEAEEPLVTPVATAPAPAEAPDEVPNGAPPAGPSREAAPRQQAKPRVEAPAEGSGGSRARVRRRTRTAPSGLCQACWNEERGKSPAVAHSHGRGDTRCRLAGKRQRADGRAPNPARRAVGDGSRGADAEADAVRVAPGQADAERSAEKACSWKRARAFAAESGQPGSQGAQPAQTANAMTVIGAGLLRAVRASVPDRSQFTKQQIKSK